MKRHAKRRAAALAIILGLAVLVAALLFALRRADREARLCVEECLSHSVACKTLREGVQQSRALQQVCETHREQCRARCR